MSVADLASVGLHVVQRQFFRRWLVLLRIMWGNFLKFRDWRWRSKVNGDLLLHQLRRSMATARTKDSRSDALAGVVGPGGLRISCRVSEFIALLLEGMLVKMERGVCPYFTASSKGGGGWVRLKLWCFACRRGSYSEIPEIPGSFATILFICVIASCTRQSKHGSSSIEHTS